MKFPLKWKPPVKGETFQGIGPCLQSTGIFSVCPLGFSLFLFLVSALPGTFLFSGLDWFQKWGPDGQECLGSADLVKCSLTPQTLLTEG